MTSPTCGAKRASTCAISGRPAELDPAFVDATHALAAPAGQHDSGDVGRGQIRPSSNCTSTVAPAGVLPCVSGRTMKQLAWLIEDRMAEPWSPVTRTVHWPDSLGAQDAALKLGAPGRLLDRRRADRLQHRQRRGFGYTHQHQQGLAHELVERHHRRDRVAGQPEEVRLTDACRTRAAGPASLRSSRTAPRRADRASA